MGINRFFYLAMSEGEKDIQRCKVCAQNEDAKRRKPCILLFRRNIRRDDDEDGNGDADGDDRSYSISAVHFMLRIVTHAREPREGSNIPPHIVRSAKHQHLPASYDLILRSHFLLPCLASFTRRGITSAMTSLFTDTLSRYKHFTTFLFFFLPFCFGK